MSVKSQKELKAVIISNIMVLCLSFIMLSVMTFAWFTAGWNENVEQVMHVGVFNVDLTDTSKSDSSLMIEAKAAFPMTYSKAQAEVAAGEKVVYAFELENTGTVTAQIRLHAQVLSDSGYGVGGNVRPLSEQLRFAAKVYHDPLSEPNWSAYDPDGEGEELPVGGLLFMPEPATVGAISFKNYFNDILLIGDDSIGYTATDKGTLYPNILSNGNGDGTVDTSKPSKLYVKLLVWLDSAATLESTGEWVLDESSSKLSAPTLKFKVFMSATQKGGGAHFTAAEVGLIGGEKVPTDKTVVTQP